MKIRDLTKMRFINDGSRTLFESTMMYELIQSLKDLNNTTLDFVLIGGLALSYYALPRMTQDIDVLFLSEDYIPNQVPGFKKTRLHALQHNKSHTEVELLTPEFLKLPLDQVKKIFDTAIVSNNMKIASPDSLVYLKLQRCSMRDQADIVDLFNTGKVSDTLDFKLSKEQYIKFNELKEIAKTDSHGVPLE